MSAAESVAGDVIVRHLRPDDLEAVVALDARHVGRRRDEFFRLKLRQAMTDTGITVSLAAEQRGRFVGFLLARVFYGEFGVTEQVAMLDVIGVHPDFGGQGVATALLDQLCTNLRGLGIGTLRTEVGWHNQALLAFFHREGFALAQRVCLDLDLRRPAPSTEA
ncbi:MAG: GNAT family N-acetyltransferase [Acidobacteriota bacterium]